MSRRLRFLACCLTSILGIGFACLVSVRADETPGAYSPKISPASNEGQAAIARFRIPKGFKLELWASEPMFANPVAFCLDEKGRIYVAETFRQQKGVEDNRGHMDWLDDDLAAMTVEDRLAFFQKHLGEKLASYGIEHDQIRLLEDTDNDGTADKSTLFAGGFNGIVEGTGAGVLARGGRVFYTNIPHVWSLADTTGDGRSDEKTSLHYGYGVRVAFRGHDSHGLRMGPDGRLYFSIGDRGFNVLTRDGDRLVYPDQGAVLRCNLDGSELEVVHTGLRNPQELAFDEFGNLFTGDNNSDSGDRARWVSIVEGGDSGWRMNFQYLKDRGPWNREKLWHPQHEGQAAWIVPPLANIADGPSGLTYAPGVGFPDEFQGRFYLCDFRGGAQGSGVRSVKVEPKGASYTVVENKEFTWNILATDVDFAADGSMFISDWVQGWDGPGKGRIYRLSPDTMGENADATAAKRLLAEGFSHRSANELGALLSHPSQVVRQESQFALADLPLEASHPILLTQAQTAADTGPKRLARLHGIWGLAQAYRQHVRRNGPIEPARKLAMYSPLAKLLSDPDLEVRAQAARAIGEFQSSVMGSALATALSDPEPRVRYFAAQAVGRLGSTLAIEVRNQLRLAIVKAVRENADVDVYLRHGLVMALAGLGDFVELQRFSNDSNVSVRLAVCLAYRKLRRAEIGRFLQDSDSRIVDEAARAIHDVPIADGNASLACLANRSGLSEPTLYRVIAANVRLGTSDAAQAIALIAGNSSVPSKMRAEAASALATWGAPSPRDRVLGSWRPIPPREAQVAQHVVQASLGAMLAGNDEVRKAATDAAVKLGIKEIGKTLLGQLKNTAEKPATRADAVRSLALLNDADLNDGVQVAIRDASPLVRAAGLRVLAKLDATAAIKQLSTAVESTDLAESQSAIAALGEMKSPDSQELLAALLKRLQEGTIRTELALDVQEAASARESAELRASVATYVKSLGDDPAKLFASSRVGGDAERGRQIFFDKAEVYCVRCHKVDGRGGEVGPDLSRIATQHPREYLLDAVVTPDKAIAKGFEPVVILTNEGKQLAGTLREETETVVRLMTAEGNVIEVKKSDIDERSRGKSSMPEDVVKKMTRFELRDVIEFLATRK